MGQCFIVRRGMSGSGSSSEIHTPDTLGYSSGCKILLDGIYNMGNYGRDEDVTNIWMNLADKNTLVCATRTQGIIEDNCYITSDIPSSLVGIPPISHDNNNPDNNSFTIETVFEIMNFSYTSATEFDIMSNFSSSGFGISIEQGILYIQININGSYKALNTGIPIFNKKYYTSISYSYENSLYELRCHPFEEDEQIKQGTGSHTYSSSEIALGMAGNKRYAGGLYKFYRFAVYNKALNDSEILQNYQNDVLRYGS